MFKKSIGPLEGNIPGIMAVASQIIPQVLTTRSISTEARCHEVSIGDTTWVGDHAFNSLTNNISTIGIANHTQSISSS